MKILNKKTKIEFKNDLDLTGEEKINFAYKNAIELEKSIDFSKILIKLQFSQQNETEGFIIYCYEELSDFEKKILNEGEASAYFSFFIDNPTKQFSFEIDLEEHFNEEEFNVDRIAIIPKEKKAIYECLIIEK